MFDKIIVLDYGSQYNQLLVRRVRERGVYSELWPNKTPIEKIKSDPTIKGIIISGSPHCVNDEGAPLVDKELFDLDIPVLGVCYGMQLMAKVLGGQVVTSKSGEFGLTDVTITGDSLLTENLEARQILWMSHNDQVSRLPKDFVNLAETSKTPFAAMQHKSKPLYGVQYHPEVHHSVNGQQIIDNFITNICGVEKTYTMGNFITQQTKAIQEKVGDNNVILGLSGGVDSSVVAALLSKAIGSQLYCIFVDHGLLRKNEVEEVVNSFDGHFDLNLIVVDAQARFLDKLKGVDDPEQKRKIIGHEFIEVFDEEALKIKNAKFLAQGTLYTDVIESGTDSAEIIKSHHNVGGLPEDMTFELIEPLNTLFKDEVRELGRELGLPDHLVDRQPFPGPGIGIRIIGDITKEKVKVVQDSDYIFREEIANNKLNKSIWQYFTVLTPIKTVGVMGDQRTYENVLVLRAVTSTDGMTAQFAHIPHVILDSIATRIINEVKGVNRVVYDITSKPPGTIEWE